MRYTNPRLYLGIRSFVRYQTCEQDNVNRFFKTDFAENRRNGLPGKDIKRSTLGSVGQRSRSHDDENRYEGLAKASFLTPSVDPFGRR